MALAFFAAMRVRVRADPRFRERKNMKTLHKQSVMLLAALAAAQMAFAAGPSAGASANAGVGASANARATAPTTGPGMNVGAAADADPSAKALENANGQFIEDRKFGQDRAQERRSAQGAANEESNRGVGGEGVRQRFRPGQSGPVRFDELVDQQLGDCVREADTRK
jgi:hypothetical protein